LELLELVKNYPNAKENEGRGPMEFGDGLGLSQEPFLNPSHGLPFFIRLCLSASFLARQVK
jgi:hypothetical protein